MKRESWAWLLTHDVVCRVLDGAGLIVNGAEEHPEDRGKHASHGIVLQGINGVCC